MRRVASTFSVNNEFKDFQAGTRNGTVYPSRWLNDVQRELLGIQTAAGVSEGAGSDGRVLASIKKIWMDERRKPGTEYSGLVYREPAAFDVGDLDAYFNGICLDAIDGSQDFSDANWPDLVPVLRSVKMRSGARTVFNCVIVGQDIFLADSTDENNLISALAEWQVDFGSYTDWISVTVEGSEFPITGVFPATRRISVSGFPEQGTGTCEIYPHRVPGVAGSARVFNSGDRVTVFPDGQTWSSKTSGTTEDLNSIASSIDEIVAVGDINVVCRSTDDGETWTDFTTGGGATNLNGVAYNGERFVACGNIGRAFYSDDGTLGSWVEIRYNNALSTNSEQVLSADGVFLISEDDGTLYKSIDSGITWEAASTPLSYIAQMHYSNGRLFITDGSTGLYYSDNLGASWSANVDGGTYNINAEKFASNGENKIWAIDTTEFGFWESTDNGETWTNVYVSGFSGVATASALVYSGSTLILNASKYYTSADGGRTWSSPSNTGNINDTKIINNNAISVGVNGIIEINYGSRSSILSTPFYYKYLHGGRYVP